MTNSLSEAVANMLPLIIIRFMSVSRGLSLAFFVSSVACGLVMYGSMNDAEGLIPLGIIGVKAGVSLGFSFLYFSSINFFENQYLGFQQGVCNVIGRSSTILAPMIAEKPDPVPMMSCIVLCISATVLTVALSQPENLKTKNKEEA